MDLDVSGYDRSAVSPGIVHIGVGGFHRAHQAVFIDDVLALGALDWGIIGVGLLPGDAPTVGRARSQDCLYSLTTVTPDGHEHVRVIGSILEHLYAPEDTKQILAQLASPGIRIVSLTITEGGYELEGTAGAVRERPSHSVWGLLLEGLRRRREAGVPPFTVLSCDNIQGNGEIARLALTGFARRHDPDLADWVTEHVAFPSSMVDRITPVVTPELATGLKERHGLVDAWPIRSEDFVQWVIEDHFPAGRPPLERVGAQLVPDVAPFERMKLRLLNASHQVMGHLGLLAGFTMVHETCRNETFARFIHRYMTDEAIPTLGTVPGTDLEHYCHQLMERFCGTRLADTLARQVVDASDRIQKFLLPVVRDQLEVGGPIGIAALVLAAWRTRILTVADLTDRRSEALRTWAGRDEQEPGTFLEYQEVFGDLGDDRRLREAWVTAVATLDELGAMGAVARLAS